MIENARRSRSFINNSKSRLCLLTSSLLLSAPALCQAGSLNEGAPYAAAYDEPGNFISSELDQPDHGPLVAQEERFADVSGEIYETESTIEVDGVAMNLSARLEPDRSVNIDLIGDDGRYVKVALNASNFRVESGGSGGSGLQHDWSQPRGDMFALLESEARGTNYGEAGAAFDELPLFYTAMNHAGAVMSADAAPQLDLVWVAANLVSNWVGATPKQEDLPVDDGDDQRILTEPVEPVGDCDIADYAIARSGTIVVEVPGVSVEVIAAEINVNADCITDNCIRGQASISRTVRSTQEDGQGCPGYGTWFDEDPYAYAAEIEFEASGGTGHCTNGVPDTARSGSVIASGGGFSGKIEAASGDGNGVSAKAGVRGSIKVCMDDDLIWDDITSVIVSGYPYADVN